MSNLKKLIFAGIVALASAFGASSQVVALKTNLIGDALLSPNLGVEFGLAPKWSLEISGQTNLWPIEGHTWISVTTRLPESTSSVMGVINSQADLVMITKTSACCFLRRETRSAAL